MLPRAAFGLRARQKTAAQTALRRGTLSHVDHRPLRLRPTRLPAVCRPRKLIEIDADGLKIAQKQAQHGAILVGQERTHAGTLERQRPDERRNRQSRPSGGRFDAGHLFGAEAGMDHPALARRGGDAFPRCKRAHRTFLDAGRRPIDGPSVDRQQTCITNLRILPKQHYQFGNIFSSH